MKIFIFGKGKGRGKGKRKGSRSSGKGKGRSINPRGKDGQIMRCHSCGSTSHLRRDCPGSGAPHAPGASPDAGSSVHYAQEFASIFMMGVDEEEGEPEKRKAPDGGFYTKAEFLEFYGDLTKWEAAATKKIPRRRLAVESSTSAASRPWWTGSTGDLLSNTRLPFGHVIVRRGSHTVQAVATSTASSYRCTITAIRPLQAAALPRRTCRRAPS